jgi:hypothetical protein
MSNRLNFFQRTMLLWRDLYPYNAVHVVTVADALDSDRLKTAISRQLAALGLTNLELDRGRGRYEWRGGAEELDLRVIARGETRRQVDDEIERELNASFPRDGRIAPFRFFAVDAGASFELGLAYDHFVAGGDSIVRLLCGIVGSYGGGAALPVTAGILSSPSYGRLLLRQVRALLRGIASLSAIAASCRRSYRPIYASIDDGRTGFSRLRLAVGEQRSLMRAAQTWGVTQNDLFIALLLKALAPLAVGRGKETVRRELAVASIVNIRRDFGSQAQAAFVPLLASFRVAHPVPDDISLKDLACSVHLESRRIRKGRLYLQTLLGLGLAASQWRFLSSAQRKGFFAKHYAVWAGTTPLNVAPLWVRAGGREPAPEYVRGVSTGPLTPMVCAISTTDEIINVGISYRTSAFDRSVIDGVLADMLVRIKNFCL